MKDGLQAKCRKCEAAYNQVHKAEIAAYQKAYNQVHKAEIAAYYQEHKEEKAAYQKAYYQEHKEEKAAYQKAWVKANPEKIAAINARRRQVIDAKMTAEDRCETREWRMRIKDNPCYYCGEITTVMEDDHLIPLSRGGTDHWWNIERSCHDCNRKKHAKTYLEFTEI